jgi:chromosome segregation ATPase
MQLEEILDNERARSKQLRQKLDIAESGPDKVGKKEVNYWRARAEQFDSECEQYKRRIAELHEDVNAAQAAADSAGAGTDGRLAERESRLAESAARIATLEAKLIERDRRLEEVDQSRQQAEQAQQAAAERLTALDNELRQENECTINLSEIANERREQITDLAEKLDEALERYEEAKWQLERAGRFERLVTKRRKLIDSLIEGLRAKHKANTALKAGLDGLRKFKAKSEEQQQKLLIRVEELSSELRETRERLNAKRNASDAEEKLRNAAELIASLEEKLNSRVRQIDLLESELGAARAAREAAETQAAERGPAADQTSLVEDLKLERDHLKAELLKQPQDRAVPGQEPTAESAAELRKKDSLISDLRRAVKDQEREIARLNDAVAGWQKKYEFLSADAPSAYQSASSGEK